MKNTHRLLIRLSLYKSCILTLANIEQEVRADKTT